MLHSPYDAKSRRQLQGKSTYALPTQYFTYSQSADFFFCYFFDILQEHI